MTSSLSRKNVNSKFRTFCNDDDSSSIIHHSYVPTISLPQKLIPSVSELIDLDHRYHPVYPSSSTTKTGDSVGDSSCNRLSEPDQGMAMLQGIILQMREPKYNKVLINGQDYGSNQPRDELGGYCNFIKEKHGEWAKEKPSIKIGQE